jgi:hypothetical protein
MKKRIITFCLSFGFYGYGYSQTVNDIPIEDIESEWVQIIGETRTFSNKMTIHLDYGQQNRNFTGRDQLILDRYGRVMDFNSMMDALNFMIPYGFEFVQALNRNCDKSTEFVYILRRKPQ